MRIKFIVAFLVVVFFCFTISICKAQTWAWAKSGVCNEGYGMSVCVDTSGNIYQTGMFNSPTLTFGTYTLNNSLGFEPFLVKYDSNGNVIWARTSNSTFNDFQANAVCTDVAGNVFMLGTYGASMIAFGSFTLNYGGGSNIFLVKYDPNGNVLWAKNTKGLSQIAQKITCDRSGNVFMAGNYNGPTCIFDTYTLTSTGSQDAFLAKYGPNGNVLWARGSEGTTYDNGWSVSTDSIGNSYFSGFYTSPSITFGTYTLTNSGGSGSAFLVKYDSNGSILWAQTSNGLTSSSYAQGYSVSSDAIGNTYLGGSYGGQIAFGTYSINVGTIRYVLWKFDTNGNVIWARTPSNLYNAPNAQGYAVSTNGTNTFISGVFMDTLYVGTYTLMPQAGASMPMYIVEYDANGNVLFATELSSGGSNQQNNNYVDKYCNAYFTGDFRGSPTNPVIGTTTLTQTGTKNPFLAKLNNNCLGTGINEKIINSSISLYPNPNNGTFVFKIEGEIKNGELIIFNSLGQEIQRQKVIRGHNKINGQGFYGGLFYYTLLENHQSITNGKFVIE